MIDCLTIGKIIVASLLFFAQFRTCLIYVAVCIVVWLAISYPKYRGKNRFIKIESEEEFDKLVGKVVKPKEKDEEEVEEYHAYQYRDKMMYFVEFYADWLSLCNTVTLPSFRANSCGMSIPTATPPPNSNSSK